MFVNNHNPAKIVHYRNIFMRVIYFKCSEGTKQLRVQLGWGSVFVLNILNPSNYQSNKYNYEMLFRILYFFPKQKH